MSIFSLYLLHPVASLLDFLAPFFRFVQPFVHHPCDAGRQAVDVAGSEHDDHFEAGGLPEQGGQVFFTAEASRDVLVQAVQDELARDPGDRLLAGGVDVRQDDLVGQRETVGKVGIEVAR